MIKTHQNINEWTKYRQATPEILRKLNYLQNELDAECISTEELAELQSLVEYINPNDVSLLEAAGIPEFDDGSITEKLIDTGEVIAQYLKDHLVDVKDFSIEEIDGMDISDQAIVFTTIATQLGWDTPELWEACKIQEDKP